MDESVGRVVNALKVTGMLQNSVVVFFSDNGSPSNDSPYPNFGSNYPFRGVTNLKKTLFPFPVSIWNLIHFSGQGFEFRGRGTGASPGFLSSDQEALKSFGRARARDRLAADSGQIGRWW